MNKFLFVIFALLLGNCDDSRLKSGQDSLEIGDYSRARQAFGTILDQEVKNQDARYGLAIALLEDSRIKPDSTFELLAASVREFEILSRQQSTLKFKSLQALALRSFGETLFYGENWDFALQILDSAEKVQAGDFNTQKYRARVLFGMGLQEDAISAGEKLLESFPEERDSYLILGDFFWQRGQKSDALVVWEKGSSKFPEDNELKYWFLEALNSLGLLDAE